MKTSSFKTTALVLTYNQEGLIEDAIESVVNQVLQPDEIFISDDCSIDGTFHCVEKLVEEVRKSGRFKGDIRLNRNEHNLGFIPHFNLAVNACQGDIILYQAGDDISMPERLMTFVNAYEERDCPKYFLGHSSALVRGGPNNGSVWEPPIALHQLTIEQRANAAALHIGATQCFTKHLFSDFGPIRFNQAYEDLVLGFRASLVDAYWYCSAPLITYRYGGLTSWQKNTWEKKRERYRDVLSQRSLDALRQGRPDLLTEVWRATRDYGFTLLPNPKRIDVYGFEDVRDSVFDYSIQEHFHRLPFALSIKRLSHLDDLLLLKELPLKKDQTLIFLAPKVIGWPSILAGLGMLDGTGLRVSVDCGIDLTCKKELLANTSIRDALQAILKKNPNFSLTTACPILGAFFRDLFGPNFVPSPLLIDVDGPSIPRRSLKQDNLLRVLVMIAEDSNLHEVSLQLENEASQLKVVYGTESIDFFLPSVALKACRHGIEPTFVQVGRWFELKECKKQQIETFDHLILFESLVSESATVLQNLRWQAIAKSIPVSIMSNKSSRRILDVCDFDLHRAGLYFQASIQKQVVQLKDYLARSMGLADFLEKLGPL